MNRFENKDPSEKIVLTFNFSAGLTDGETLSGTATASATLAFGYDVTPSAVLNGPPAIDSTQKLVLVPVQGGIADCDYIIKVVVPTSNPTKVLALSALLPVRT